MNINEKISQLEKERTRLQIAGGIIMLLLILCFGLIIWKPMYGMILFAVLILVYVIPVRTMLKRYQMHIKQVTFEESLRSKLKEIQYLEKDGLSRQEIADAHFPPVERPDVTLIKDTIRGTYQRKPVILAEVTTDFNQFKETGSGKSKKYIDYLSGCLFDITLPGDTGLQCMIWPSGLLSRESLALYYSDFEPCGFADHVKSDEKEINRLDQNYSLLIKKGSSSDKVNDRLIKEYLHLDDYTPDHAALQVSGNHLRIFIRNRFLYNRKVPVRNEIDPRFLTYNEFSEINPILRIADAVIQS